MGMCRVKKRANEEPLVSTEHQGLFHYTSLFALEGILGTNTLWATHAEHLNDSSEMKLLWPKLASQCVAYLKAAFEAGPGRDPEQREIVERLGGAAEIAAKDATMIVNVMQSFLFGDESKPAMGIPFVTSFTTHHEEYHCQNGMLSQWRGYGGDQGVAIVFDTAQLENLLRSEYGRFEYLCCSIADAVYYDKELNLEDRFPKLFDALKCFSKDVVDGLNDDEKALRNSNALVSKLLPAVGRLKHWAFLEEKECRVIVGVPHESHGHKFAQLADQRKHMKTIHHRSGSFGSIPYIRLFEDLGEELPILRILVGPSRNQAANSEAVHELLTRLARGRAIKVQESKIPYVSSA